MSTTSVVCEAERKVFSARVIGVPPAWSGQLLLSSVDDLISRRLRGPDRWGLVGLHFGSVDKWGVTAA